MHPVDDPLENEKPVLVLVFVPVTVLLEGAGRDRDGVAKRTIILIVDRGPAHRAKKTAAFVETLGGKLRLFFLPPYSPDRNPDELVWKHLKSDTAAA